MNDYYNDTGFSYDRFWHDRAYEHASEVMAISRLLAQRKFALVADIGGGFGRLTKILGRYADNITLIEPAAKMRAMAKSYLASVKNVQITSGSAGRTPLAAASQNLVVSVRVLHHITNLADPFAEFARITKPGGLLLIEFANSLNIKARIRSLLSGKPIMLTPVDIRSPINIKKQTITFVNHHPHTVLKLLLAHNFTVKKIYSVSNLRSPLLKKLVPLRILMALEYLLQIPLSGLYFGPSIFILAQKVDI